MNLAREVATRACRLGRGLARLQPADPSAPASADDQGAAAAAWGDGAPAGSPLPAEAKPTKRPAARAARQGSTARTGQAGKRRIATEPIDAAAIPDVPTRGVRILLVEDVPEVVTRVRELLRSQGTYRLVAVTTDGRRAQEDVLEHRPDVVLVDVLLQGRVSGPAVIERLRRTRNPLPCVAITLADRPLAAEVASGADAVMTYPFGTFNLVRAVRDAITAGAVRNPTLASRIVAVFSAKGGVGKTTIALNLAVALRELGLRTALVDGSLQFGDLRRLLGAADALPSILDLPTDSVRSSDLVELMVSGPGGVDILFAPPRLEQAELVTTRDLDKMLDMLRRAYHAVVIDTASSLGEATLAMLDASDVIVQVVTPETAALDVTRLAAEAFAGIGYPPAKLKLLVNRVDTQGSMTASEIRQTFGRDPDFAISSDWALVAASNARGVPFVDANPDAAVSRDVQRLAGHLGAIVGAAPRDPTATRHRGWAA